MNPLTPAANQKEYERKIETVTLCGKNRGPHDYIPVAWSNKEGQEWVTMFMCRVCFTRVSNKTLIDNFDEAKL